MNGSKSDETGQGQGGIKGDTQFAAGVPGWMMVLLSDIWEEEGRGEGVMALSGTWLQIL